MKVLIFVGKVISIIIIISAVTGIVAGIIDQIKQWKEGYFAKKSGKTMRTMGTYEQFIKRPLDVFLSTGALIVFSPAFIIVYILVRIKLGRPVFFVQERPGRIDSKTSYEKNFRCYKFRTMIDKRDENGELLPDEVRLTKFGEFLRSTSLDELPQLINIIKGDMAVIGPRALLVKYLPFYTEEQRHRHDVRPGLVGLATINGRNNQSWDSKFKCDEYYAKHVSFALDLKILIGAVRVTLSREGVVEDGQATMEDYEEYLNRMQRENEEL